MYTLTCFSIVNLQELEALADPMRKEVSLVRKRIDTVNKELKPLGTTVQKKVTIRPPLTVIPQICYESAKTLQLDQFLTICA